MSILRQSPGFAKTNAATPLATDWRAEFLDEHVGISVTQDYLSSPIWIDPAPARYAGHGKLSLPPARAARRNCRIGVSAWPQRDGDRHRGGGSPRPDSSESPVRTT
jgi:hypothetical protein